LKLDDELFEQLWKFGRRERVLSLSDIPLARDEASNFLKHVLNLEDNVVAALFRQLRSAGAIEVFGGERFKIHDAMRLIGLSHLDTLGKDAVQTAQIALKDLLSSSIQAKPDISKLPLYMRMLAATGDIKTLVQFATDELFHELGVMPEIVAFLEKAASSDKIMPEDRFWALDGLAFSDLKQGETINTSDRLSVMESLIAEHDLGDYEKIAVSMKRMGLAAKEGDANAVIAALTETSGLIPDKSTHQRVFRYNAAHALYHLDQYEAVIDETWELIEEYYDVLGIGPEEIVGKNIDKIWPLLKRDEDHTDNLKHLADCLDLYAKAMNFVGKDAALSRIHAMKFYEMVQAFDSVIRVGQDLVDEFVGRNDFVGARNFIERNLLPIVLHFKLVGRVIPVRSQYAVVLAYCRDFDAADAEMERLAPFKAGLEEAGQQELENQRQAIAELQRTRPPKQWVLPKPPVRAMTKTKIGRNELCPCGSGLKYKRCHGRKF
jgi:hypothetical protein